MEGTPISKTIRWSKLHCFGSDTDGNSIMVMDLLGPNIESLLQKTSHRRDVKGNIVSITAMIECREHRIKNLNHSAVHNADVC